MKSSVSGRVLTGAYLLLFFAYLFGPLIIMTLSAFNSSTFPRVTPWECFTTDWFGKLGRDDRLLEGLQNSLIIGFWVVLMATPIGLAAALLISQVGERLRSLLYTIFIAAILFPGVVIGISTLVFWQRLGGLFDAGIDSFFFDGIFLTILGQVTFISAYAMLVFLSRLQRFDPTQTEAALDLGATQAQAFRKILLPFLRPAIFSSAVLAFLASLENYNTTTLTIQAESTFTTVLASKVRYGIDPSISAVAVIIIGITLIGAIVHEAKQQRDNKLAAGSEIASSILGNPVARVLGHPAFVALILAGLTALVFYGGSQHDSSACRADVLEQKRAVQEELRKKTEERLKKLRGEKKQETDIKVQKPKTGFGGVFQQDNLSGGKAKEVEKPAKPKTGFGNVFDPNNLEKSE